MTDKTAWDVLIYLIKEESWYLDFSEAVEKATEAITGERLYHARLIGTQIQLGCPDHPTANRVAEKLRERFKDATVTDEWLQRDQETAWYVVFSIVGIGE